MSVIDLLPLLAKAHPALVHAPISAVIFLPLALGLAFRSKLHGEGWLRTSVFLATLGMLGGFAAVLSGFFFARELGGLAQGAWLAHPLRPEPSFLALLRSHQLLALAGFPIGGACWVFLWRALQGRASAIRVAFVMSFLWLALWGAAGHWGGRMVFRDPPAEGSLP